MQKNYNTILFDLDGTISDSKLGITKSFQYALSSFGIRITDLEELTVVVGPPLSESFSTHFGFGKEKASKAIEKFREYYSTKGCTEHRIYDGMTELLSSLGEAGKDLVIATSKPTLFANMALNNYGISSLFSFVAGSNLDNTRTTKIEVLEYALESIKNSQKETMVMIGDRKEDIIAANHVGVDSIGILYGYGSEEEVLEYNPTHTASSVDELGKILGL